MTGWLTHLLEWFGSAYEWTRSVWHTSANLFLKAWGVHKMLSVAGLACMAAGYKAGIMAVVQISEMLSNLHDSMNGGVLGGSTKTLEIAFDGAAFLSWLVHFDVLTAVIVAVINGYVVLLLIRQMAMITQLVKNGGGPV